MKLIEPLVFPLRQNLNISDTDELNAQKLLALFLDEIGFLDYLVSEHSIIKELFEQAENLPDPNKSRTLSDAICDLCASVCTCFLDFLAVCPHVHITID